MKLLLYGLQRSGTNYLEALLKRTYRVKFLNDKNDRSSIRHKHVRLYAEKDRIPEPQYKNQLVVNSGSEFFQQLDIDPDFVLIISKDPYSWYISYQKWAKKCDWPPVNHHYIEEYNLFYGKWLDLAEANSKFIFVQYAELLENPDAVIEKLAVQMDLKTTIWSAIRNRFSGRDSRISKVSHSGSFNESQQEYYQQKQYMADFNEAELNQLNEALDLGVLEKLGYQIHQTHSADLKTS